MHTITINERMACMSDMPAALMAVSSELSPRLPKVISDESSMASGNACGMSMSPMYERKPLANQLVDIAPQELHHQHKLADEERSEEQQAELLGYEYV